MKYHLFALSLLLVLCLPLIIPFWQAGYFPTQDGEWAIVRLAEMHREIKDRQFPPRWSTFLNHGYGYPLFLFTYPLPYYLGEASHLLGVGLVDSIKLVFAVTVIGSLFSMYLLTSSLGGIPMGILATLLYLYAPYRLTNLFVRGSIGESLALVFFPLLWWLVKQIFVRSSILWITLFALGIAGFMLTHNAMVVLFLPFLCLWVGYLYLTESKNKNQKLILVGLSFLTGLLLSAHFWLPAVGEKAFIALSQTPLANQALHFLTLGEILGSSFPNGLHPPVQVGLGLVLVLIAGLLLAFFDKGTRNQTLFFSALALISLFLLLSGAQLIWKLPLMKEIDFPWRMLGVVVFLIPLAAASLQKQFWYLVLGILVIIVIFYSWPLVKTQPRIFRSDEYYQTNDATTTSADELMPIWVAQKPTNRPDQITIGSLAFTSSQTEIQSNSIEFELTGLDPQPTSVVVNHLYFPGWRLFIDNQPTQINITPRTGLISFMAPTGKHKINLQFGNTRMTQIADILSLVGIVMLGSLWIFSKKLAQFGA